MMRRQVFAAIRAFVALTVILGLAYPLAVTAVAQVTMRDRADGSLVTADGRVVGSSLLGQRFTQDRYFHPRPGDYDPTASGPSNLGPTNPDLLREVAARTAALGVPSGTVVPADAVTASGSGLDPDISPAYARLQAARVAEARGLPPAQVLALIERMTRGRALGIFGEPRINVLQLNLYLDTLGP